MSERFVAYRSGATFTFSVPDPVRGRWCRIFLESASSGKEYAIKLRIRPQGRDFTLLQQYAVCRLDGRSRVAIAFLPADGAEVHIDIFGFEPEHGSVRVRLLPVSRGVAAILLLMRSPSRLLKAVRGPPGGLARRIRALLITLLQNRPKQLDYPIWVDLFDRWSDNDRDTLLSSPRRRTWPTIGLLVDQGGAAESACNTTNASLQGQWLPASVTTVCLQDSMPYLGDLMMERPEEYIAILQAGEVLPPQAIAVFADQAARLGFPDALYADEDRIGADMRRTDPHFKPEAGPVLLASGLLTRGIWLFRRDRLETMRDVVCMSADAMRLEIALRIASPPLPGVCRRIPFILSHRRFDAVEVPPRGLGDIVRQYLAAASLVADVEFHRGIPLRVRIARTSHRPRRRSPSSCHRRRAPRM